jgi:pseudaminic acid synthase
MKSNSFKLPKNDDPAFIVAELSANHNNNFQLTVKTLEAMAAAGADAVKIQTYTAESLTLNVDNEYFGERKDGLWKGRRPYDIFSDGSLPYEWQPKLKEVAEKLGLVFFSSPFDQFAVDFLEKMNVCLYKVASPEINDIPLIAKISKTGKPIILSTGMAELKDIQLAIDTIRINGGNDYALLKCTSQYPAQFCDANLRTIPNMRDRFGCTIGVSDHSEGDLVPLVATSLGAKIIEKHFTLSRSLGGIDSAFSMEPHEFASMVKSVRNAELSLGEVTYELKESDKLRRRSLFVTSDIKKGDELNESNFRSVRPGHGMQPVHTTHITGKKARIDIPTGTPLRIDHFE